MKNLFKLVLLLGLVVLARGLRAQNAPTINATVSGRVVDGATREPLIGATVQIKGITNGSVTDVAGHFELKTAQVLPFALVVSYVGYRSQEVIATTATVDVALKADASQLNDVVVVGYGTQRRSDITGAISSIPTELKTQPVASVERLLQGAVAGASVTQTSGQPGGGVSVQIRGSNSVTAGSDPLYVIDGFPINNDYSLNDAGVTNGAKINPLSSINTSDIENIEVLKDASATAIYGSRGANGVIIITTKSGAKGKSSVNYEGYYGVQEVIRTIPLLNAAEWWALRQEAATNSGKTATLPAVQGYALDVTGAGTDWQAAAFRQAPVQNHNVSFLSGSEQSRLAISGNYFKQDGVLHNTDFTRYSGRINLAHDYNPRFRLTTSLNVSYTNANVAPAAIVGALLLTPPALPIYKDDGSFVTNSPFESALQNPINSLYSQLNQTVTTRVLGSVAGEFRLAEGLQAKVLFGTDLLNNKQNRYLPRATFEGQALGGNAVVGSVLTTNWLNENTLNYERQLGETSKLSALVGFTAQQSDTEGAVAEAAGFANDALSYHNLGTGITNRTPGSFNSKWALASYLGRVNYSYAERYLLTLTLRADGSSRFGGRNKWGYFPSAAIGWNVNNEAFFPEIPQLTLLKVRASAGLTGNQSIPTYQSLAQLGYFRYNFSNTTVSGYAPVTVRNAGLGWEKTLQLDGGLDLGLLNNRVDLVADVYYKKTTDLLLNRTVPGTSGLSNFYGGQASSVYQNVGAVSNKGLELSINAHTLTGKFKWNTILVYAKNANEVLSLGDGVREIIPDNSQPSIARVGQPLGSFIVYQTAGVIQNGEKPLTPQANKNPGGQQYKDVNGDGILTQADRIVVANQVDFTYGITNTFAYKGFDLTVFLQGSQGGKLYNANQANLELGTGYVNGSRNLLDRWTPGNPNTDVKAAYQDPAITISDRFIEDGTYLRFKNLTLGYTLPASLLAPLHVQRLRLYASAQNLATWTRYTGFDPEVSLNGQSLINKGVDSGVYPNSKTFLAGLILSL